MGRRPVRGGDRAARGRASKARANALPRRGLSHPSRTRRSRSSARSTIPMIGVCVHWFYGPHTTDGVVGQGQPAPARRATSRAAGPASSACSTPAPASRAWRGRSLAHLDRRARLDRGRRVHGAPRRVVHDRPHRVPETEIAYTRRSRLPTARRSRATSPTRSAAAACSS